MCFRNGTNGPLAAQISKAMHEPLTGRGDERGDRAVTLAVRTIPGVITGGSGDNFTIDDVNSLVPSMRVCRKCRNLLR